MTYTQEQLAEILAKHKRWLNNEVGPRERADLSGADLEYANLEGAYLEYAVLSRADLTGANLAGANLAGADLAGANLAGAHLSRANLAGANLTGANLTRANLAGANLDFASWPLWCGTLYARIDKRLAAQLLYHALRAMQSAANDADVAAVLASEANIRLANQFHRVDECGRIEAPAEGGDHAQA